MTIPPGFAGVQFAKVPLKAVGPIILGVIGVTFFPFSGMADIMVSSSAPAENVLAATNLKTPPATVGWKNDSAANQWTGVTFQVVKEVTLERITLAYSNVGEKVANAKVTVSIIQLGAETLNFSNRIKQGTTLQTETFEMPATLPETGYLTFDVTDIALPPSPVPYAYVLSFESTASKRSMAFTKGEAGNESGAVALDSKSMVFRSDDGGEKYTNLTIANVPLVYLQGTAKP